MTHKFAASCAAVPLVLLVVCPPARAEKEIVSLSLGLSGTSGVIRVAISPDGKQVAALLRGGATDETGGDNIRLVDVKTKKEVARIRPGWGNFRGLVFAYTPDGKHLVCSSEKAVHVFDVKTRKLARTFTTKAAKPWFGDLSADGKTLVCSDQQRIGVYELATGKELVGLEPPEKVYKVAISKDGKRVAAAHQGGKVTVWDPTKRKILHKFAIKGGGGGTAELAFSPDGKRLVAAGTWGSGITDTASVYDLEKGSVAASLNFVKNGMGNFRPCDVVFTAKGAKVVLAGVGKGSGVYVWEPATGKLHGRKGYPKEGEDETPYRLSHVTAMAATPDGKLAVTGDTKVRVFDLSEAAAPPKKP